MSSGVSDFGGDEMCDWCKREILYQADSVGYRGFVVMRNKGLVYIILTNVLMFAHG